MRAAQERYRKHGIIRETTFERDQFFRVRENSEDRGTAACHRRRSCAQTAKALFDSLEFGVPGEHNFFKVVFIHREVTFRSPRQISCWKLNSLFCNRIDVNRRRQISIGFGGRGVYARDHQQTALAAGQSGSG